jgi:putative transposase
MYWARLLAYITGTVDQELLLRNEYLVAEKRILRAQLQGRLRLSDAERATLGVIGHRLGRKALEDIAYAARPDTNLGWLRQLVAHPNDQWMQQVARNVTMERWGFLGNCRYLLHDRVAKYTESY